MNIKLWWLLFGLILAIPISESTLHAANTTAPSELLLLKMELFELVKKSVQQVWLHCANQTTELYENQKMLATAINELQRDVSKLKQN